MADQYIDQDETQIYGPYTSRMLRERLIGEVASFDTALTLLAQLPQLWGHDRVISGT